MKKTDLGLLILRVSLAFMMLFHGFAKLSHGLDGLKGMLSSKGIPGFIVYGVIIGEVVAPLLMLIGYRTKLAAMVYAFTMLIAVSLAHAAQLFTVNPDTGGWSLELQGLYFFGALALVFTGAGKYSLSSRNKWD